MALCPQWSQIKTRAPYVDGYRHAHLLERRKDDPRPRWSKYISGWALGANSHSLELLRPLEFQVPDVWPHGMYVVALPAGSTQNSPYFHTHRYFHGTTEPHHTKTAKFEPIHLSPYSGYVQTKLPSDFHFSSQCPPAPSPNQSSWLQQPEPRSNQDMGWQHGLHSALGSSPPNMMAIRPYPKDG